MQLFWSPTLPRKLYIDSCFSNFNIFPTFSWSCWPYWPVPGSVVGMRVHRPRSISPTTQPKKPPALPQLWRRPCTDERQTNYSIMGNHKGKLHPHRIERVGAPTTSANLCMHAWMCVVWQNIDSPEYSYEPMRASSAAACPTPIFYEQRYGHYAKMAACRKGGFLMKGDATIINAFRHAAKSIFDENIGCTTQNKYFLWKSKAVQSRVVISYISPENNCFVLLSRTTILYRNIWFTMFYGRQNFYQAGPCSGRRAV